MNTRIYLDNCCFNRPYDNQDQLAVRLEAERFVVVVQREPFDYTRWSADLFEDISLDELNRQAMAWQKKHFDN